MSLDLRIDHRSKLSVMDTTKATSGRRWFQFRLRTLLIAMTMCAIPMAWLGAEYRQTQRQQVAVEWVGSLGGWVRYVSSPARTKWGKFQEAIFGREVRQVFLPRMEVDDLAPLAEFTGVTDLQIRNLTTSDLTSLRELTKLRELILYGDEMTDISPLGELRDLTTLDLGGKKIYDLSPLAKLTSLERLGVGGARGRDLSPLASLQEVSVLQLYGEPVGDLAPLASLRRLQEVRILYQPVGSVLPLTRIPGLTTISLVDAEFEGLSSLAKCASLRHLSVFGMSAGEERTLSEALPECQVTRRLFIGEPIVEVGTHLN